MGYGTYWHNTLGRHEPWLCESPPTRNGYNFSQVGTVVNVIVPCYCEGEFARSNLKEEIASTEEHRLAMTKRHEANKSITKNFLKLSGLGLAGLPAQF